MASFDLQAPTILVVDMVLEATAPTLLLWVLT
jgi:hypothetical protein